MTIDNEDSGAKDTDNPDDDKSAKINEKLKKMGVMPSDDQKQEEESRRFSPFWIMILIAIPVSAYIIYSNMPDEVDDLYTSIGDKISDFTSEDDDSITDSDIVTKTDSNNNEFDETALAYLNQPSQSDRINQQRAEMERRRDEYQKNNPEPEWMVKQRAEMEKQRQEYLKQNPEPEWMVKQRAAMEKQRQDYLKQNPEPEWAVNHRAEMEKRRLEYQKKYPEPEWMAKRRAEMEKNWNNFQQHNPNSIRANSNQPTNFAEPPQWVKDRQAAMEREMAKYQNNMNNNAAGWGYNRAPAYLNHPNMNQNQIQSNNGNAVKPAPMQNNRNTVNAYPQQPGQFYNRYNYPPSPYYNAPYYRFGPHAAPYGRYPY